jgi:hypothetical protein
MAKTYSDDEVTVSPGKVYADSDVTVTPPASAAPEPDESPGVVGTVLNGAKQVGGAIVDTAKSIGRAGLAAVDLVSPVSKDGGLQVPFGQLMDPSYRREVERGVRSVVTGPAAKYLADKADPKFAASEPGDQKSAPEARNLGEVAGSFLPSPANYAVGQAAKGLGAVGEKIGSTVRSDRRLLNEVTDGARAKLRTKLERTELADNAKLIRDDPSLHKAVKDPAKFEQATAERLSKNRANADAIGENVRADTNEMVKALREKQAKLRERLDTEELADAMEKPIKKLEARAKRLEEAAAAEAPHTESRQLATSKPGKYDSELERFNHEDPAGFDYLEPNGKVTATSEQATTVGKHTPVEAATEAPKGEPYRAVRQYITNRQDDAFNYMPGAKPSAKNKAAQEVADTVKEILHSKVAQVSPESLPALKQLDRESSILARMNKIAEYKHVNSPAFNTSRLTTALKNNRGVAATAKAGVKFVFRSADEALAAIARASKGGKVPKSMLEAARDAGVKAATVDMLMTKVGRDDDKETGTE